MCHKERKYTLCVSKDHARISAHFPQIPIGVHESKTNVLDVTKSFYIGIKSIFLLSIS